MCGDPFFFGEIAFFKDGFHIEQLNCLVDRVFQLIVNDVDDLAFDLHKISRKK
jgi:hypothetical protein